MRRTRRGYSGITATLLLAASVLAGCQSSGPALKPPGPIEKQRFHATMFDPYGDVDVAPEIVGGRPREFAQPLTEGDRSRLFHKVWPFQ